MVRTMLVRSMAAAALLLALPAAAAAAAPVQQDEYTMILSPAAGAVTPGATTATLVTFKAPHYLRDTRVQLSTIGLAGSPRSSTRRRPGSVRRRC
jgi:hypothetical protein